MNLAIILAKIHTNSFDAVALEFRQFLREKRQFFDLVEAGQDKTGAVLPVSKIAPYFLDLPIDNFSIALIIDHVREEKNERRSRR